MADAWLTAQEPLLKSQELGSSVDEVEQLIRRHEAFRKAAAAWEERFSSLRRLTTVRDPRLGWGQPPGGTGSGEPHGKENPKAWRTSMRGGHQGVGNLKLWGIRNYGEYEIMGNPELWRTPNHREA